ncbi:MAG: hypothetical protein H3C50_10890 [Kiritimatiellae bacterium]|nr:hypothetical protein [Kiritimatiellia bacterium]MCO5068191.1 hypothetical protein [Kiritimatiellia bacterium]
MSQRQAKPLPRAQRIELEFLEGVYRRIPTYEPLLDFLGFLYTKLGRYEDGLRIDLELTRLRPGVPYHWYNLGCSHALLGDRTAALTALKRAVETGFGNGDLMKKDADLASLRGDPEFQELLARVESAHL